MIKDRIELKRILIEEREFYIGKDRREFVKLMLLKDSNYFLWKYIKALRYTEYYYNTGNTVLYWFSQRRKNQLGMKLGISIWHNTIEKGLKIWHNGCIVVNGHARIGKNCQLHGSNCIGNKGDTFEGAPTIGNNVDIGVGAIVIGDIYIADGVKIGANAVVTHSCFEAGAVLAGVPAKIL